MATLHAPTLALQEINFQVNPPCSCSSFVWSALLVHTQSSRTYSDTEEGGVVGRTPLPFFVIFCGIKVANIILQINSLQNHVQYMGITKQGSLPCSSDPQTCLLSHFGERI